MKTIYVNGRFLGRPVTGVERFARMVLDHVHARRSVAGGDGERWIILAPPGVDRPAQWPAFDFRIVGKRGGHLWEQLELSRAARHGILLNLCNSGPVSRRVSLTVIHDAAVYDLGENFARPYRLLHRTIGRLIARRSRVATVSAFSRQRLAAVLGLDPAAIAIIPNAADHIDAIAPDDAIIAEQGLVAGRYLLFVGSFAPNKNLPRAIEAFRAIARPEDRLVLVGAAVRSFAENGLSDVPDGVILPGRIGDGALMALYRNARALVFPSLYEGFGIPPIEAMRHGCPVVAADIPPVREVCGDAALYCDPLSVESIARAMRRILDDDGLHAQLVTAAIARRDVFSWDKSANALLAAIA